MNELPRKMAHVGVPPIKCQGIKTKLVPFILRSIRWDASGRWIEPFIGSGVVVFNVAPERAVLTDANPHIIRLYRSIQNATITSAGVREFLESETVKLRTRGAPYYYEVRERFNDSGSPLDFLFLNRSCFNGVMRFNGKGKYNVPFGHKVERFSKAYITKIVNQVSWVRRQMSGRNWEFRIASWHETLSEAQNGDFVYLDPPYIGRHTDYFSSWDEDEATRLASATRSLPCGYALSMWLENRHRRNTHIDDCWSGDEIRVCSHFYHVGSTESLRNAMEEALVIRPGYATPAPSAELVRPVPLARQLGLPLLEQTAAYG